MTTSDPWQEFLKGLEIAEEIERQRKPLIKEYRLYYNPDGSIIGMWESSYPEGDNYIVIDHPDVFHKNNTQLLQVIDKKLKIIDTRSNRTRRLYQSTTGYQVVRGHAALIINPNEEYSDTEFYGTTNN